MINLNTLPQISSDGRDTDAPINLVVLSELDAVALSDALRGAIIIPKKERAKILARRQEIAREKLLKEEIWAYVSNHNKEHDNPLYIECMTRIWNIVH